MPDAKAPGPEPVPFDSRRVMLLSTNLGLGGGAEVQVMELALALQKRQWDVRMVSLLPPGTLLPELANSGIPIHTLGMQKGIPDPRALFRLLRLLREHRPEVLHCHMTHANLLGRLVQPWVRIPAVISTLHGMQMNRVKGGSTRLRELAHHFTDRWSQVTTTVCRAAANAYVENGSVPAPKVIPFPNGVDTRLFRPNEDSRRAMRAALEIDDATTVWIAAGRLVLAKDYVTMLQAFARLRDADEGHHVLLLCGSGELEGPIREQAHQLGLLEADPSGRSSAIVRFMGFRKDIPQLLHAADCFLMSSVTEGLPIALIQAASTGIPAVATSVGGNPEVVIDQVTGYLAPPSDPEALADGMLRFTRLSLDERAAMGAAARKLMLEQYDLNHIVSEWERLYASLLDPAVGLQGFRRANCQGDDRSA